jgi:pre-mRNA-processing factor 8
VRAISATHLPLRLQHIYVPNDDVKDDAGSYTYVLPKNILRAFVTSADLRTQVGAYLYGVSPPDNKQVKEIKAIAWVPQRGNNNAVELPSQLPKHESLLKDLELLGWIKTQALEIPHLSPTDVSTQAHIMSDHPDMGSNSICITVAFTPGSVSLAAHQLTVAGFEWGRKNQDLSPNPAGFKPNMSERVQLLLSERILGMTLVPVGRVWNYGVGLTQVWSPNLAYSVTLEPPLLFWAEEHRPQAFVSVSQLAVSQPEDGVANGVHSSQTWRATTARTSKTLSHECFVGRGSPLAWSSRYLLVAIILSYFAHTSASHRCGPVPYMLSRITLFCVQCPASFMT